MSNLSFSHKSEPGSAVTQVDSQRVELLTRISSSAFTQVDNNASDMWEYGVPTNDATSDLANVYVTPVPSLNLFPQQTSDILLGKDEEEFVSPKNNKVKDESTDVFNPLDFVLSKQSINYLKNTDALWTDTSDYNNFNSIGGARYSVDDTTLLCKPHLEEGTSSFGENENLIGNKVLSFQNKSAKNVHKERSPLNSHNEEKDASIVKNGGTKRKSTALISKNGGIKRRRCSVFCGEKKPNVICAETTKSYATTSSVSNNDKPKRSRGRPRKDTTKRRDPSRPRKDTTKRRGPGRPRKNEPKVMRATTTENNAITLLSLSACTPKCQSNATPIAAHATHKNKTSRKSHTKRKGLATPRTVKERKKFNDKSFTSPLAKQFFFDAKTKYRAVMLKELRKTKPSGSNKRYTVSDVKSFVKSVEKKKEMRQIKKISTDDEITFDASKTIQQNMDRLPEGALNAIPGIEALNVEGRWPKALSCACLQIFVRFRTWPNVHKIIRQCMGNIKTSKQIRDHIGKKRRKFMKTNETHPYVLYYGRRKKDTQNLDI